MIEVTDGAEPREQRIALSMKLVNQSTGEDLDASNAEAETDVSSVHRISFVQQNTFGLWSTSFSARPVVCV